MNVTFAGVGAGTVDFGGAATSCTADCTRTFDSGTSLTLGGTATGGSAFSGFSGDCTGTSCAFPSLSAPAKNVSATFGGVYAIGGTVIGLSGSGFVLGNSINGGAPEQLAVSSNGTFVFPIKATSGESYTVTVVTQPGTPAQTCAVTAGVGNAGADVTTVEIDCPPFVVASGLDGPNTLAAKGSTLYFGVTLYPGVPNCYTGNPAAGDRVMMVPSAGGTPATLDYLDSRRRQLSLLDRLRCRNGEQGRLRRDPATCLAGEHRHRRDHSSGAVRDLVDDLLDPPRRLGGPPLCGARLSFGRLAQYLAARVTLERGRGHELRLGCRFGRIRGRRADSTRSRSAAGRR